MIRYLLDILCIGLVVTVSFLAAQRPVIDLNQRSSAEDRSKLTEAKKKKTEIVQKGIVRDVVVLKALKERNIFAADRSYAFSKSGMKGPLPENPYTLIGILKGEEKKAVFREYTGSILTLTVGKNLADGSIISRIDDLSVELKKGNEKKELKVFDLTNPARRIASPPETIPSRGDSVAPPRRERAAPPPRGQTPPRQPEKAVPVPPLPGRMVPQQPQQNVPRAG